MDAQLIVIARSENKKATAPVVFAVLCYVKLRLGQENIQMYVWPALTTHRIRCLKMFTINEALYLRTLCPICYPTWPHSDLYLAAWNIPLDKLAHKCHLAQGCSGLNLTLSINCFRDLPCRGLCRRRCSQSAGGRGTLQLNGVDVIFRCTYT